jgi:hypothetical protein
MLKLIWAGEGVTLIDCEEHMGCRMIKMRMRNGCRLGSRSGDDYGWYAWKYPEGLMLMIFILQKMKSESQPYHIVRWDISLGDSDAPTSVRRQP